MPRIKSLQPPYRLGPEEALGPGKLKVTPGLGHSPPAPCPQHVAVPLYSRSAPAQHGEETTAPSATTPITALTSPPSCWGHCTHCMDTQLPKERSKGEFSQQLSQVHSRPDACLNSRESPILHQLETARRARCSHTTWQTLLACLNTERIENG